MSPFAQTINNFLNGPTPPYAEKLNELLIPRGTQAWHELGSGFLGLAFAAAVAVVAMAGSVLA